MKDKLLVFLITFFTSCTFSQIKFEKGYFIDNNDIKTECLIKNIDWYNNPLEFDFKLNESSAAENKTINDVKEFAVSNLKYTRFLVNIDRSSKKINQLSIDRNPIFKKETLFLKSLVEGNSNLYYYKDDAIDRFFYSIPDTKEVEQLIYKAYKYTNNHIKENNRFRQQLLLNLVCPSISNKKVKEVEYKTKDLIAFFDEYNRCNNSESIRFDNKKNKEDLFNLNIRPGVNSSSLSISNSTVSSSDKDYENKLNLRFGIEAEFIFAFNKNKWSVLIEPTYQSYKVDNVDYKSIELPVGVRHYLFLNNNTKVFVNGLFVNDFPLGSTVRNLEIWYSPNIALGLGCNVNKKYSMEIRYFTDRGILGKYLSWGSNYKTISFIVGYNLF